MATPRSRHKHIRVQFIRRRSFKQRSKRAKYRKRNNKSTRIARSLITPSLLKQNTRFTHVSIVRISTLPTEKIGKNKKLSQTEHNHIQLLQDPQRRNLKHTILVSDTSEQFHSTKISDPNVSKSFACSGNNVNSTTDKIVLSTSRIFRSNQTHQSNQKNVKPLYNTTIVLSPSLVSRSYSTIIRSNKTSLVHPNNEDQHSSSRQKKRKQRFSPCDIVLACIILTLLIAGIIVAIVIPLMMREKATTSSSTVVPTTATVPFCTISNYMACSTLMYHNLNSGFLPPTAWTNVSCCYVAPVVNQITIEFAVQEDDAGYWLLDDISASQGNGELVSNGGFEYNMTNWTLIIYSNATSTTAVDSQSGGQHTGNAYLYGASANAPVYVKQTFSILQGQNVLISFWWNYFPAFGITFGTSELTVTLT